MYPWDVPFRGSRGFPREGSASGPQWWGVDGVVSPERGLEISPLSGSLSGSPFGVSGPIRDHHPIDLHLVLGDERRCQDILNPTQLHTTHTTPTT